MRESLQVLLLTQLCPLKNLLRVCKIFSGGFHLSLDSTDCGITCGLVINAGHAGGPFVTDTLQCYRMSEKC